VRINSTFPDGSTSIKTVAFGGSSNMNTSQTNTSTELTNQLSWFSASNKHRIKLTTEARRDAFTQNQQTNTLGSFAFNSLADLEGQQPSSFSRQLAPRIRSGSQFIGGLSLGDSYKRSDDLQLQYGIRLDGNHFSATPHSTPIWRASSASATTARRTTSTSVHASASRGVMAPPHRSQDLPERFGDHVPSFVVELASSRIRRARH